MHKKYSSLTIIILSLFFVIACSEKEEVAKPEEQFTRIYDFNLWGGIYNTLDVKVTKDEGYVVLANFEDAPYIMKTDKNGDFEWDTWDYSSDHPEYIPVPSCMEVDDNYYFFASSIAEDTQPLVFMKVNKTGKTPEIIASFGEINENIVPFYSIKNNDNEVILLAGLPNERKAWLAYINVNGEIIREQKFDYNSDISISHPSIQKRFHHLGNIDDDTFYCNTYTGSEIVTHIIDRVDGFIYDEIHHALPATSIAFFDDDIFVTGFPIWDIYGIQLPDADDIQTENVVSSASNSTMCRIVVNEKEYAVFSANSRDNQVLIKIFDPNNSDMTAKSYKKFYGNTYFFDSGGVFQTPDGGLMIYGNAYVMGRVGRIFLIKLSKTELEEMVSKI